MAAAKKTAGGTLARASTGQKAMLGGLLLVLVVVGYWVALHRPVADDLDEAETLSARLIVEERSWVAKQASYHEDKKELNAQRAREREQLKILPNESNMDSFLDNLNGLAELSGLTLESTTPQEEEAEDFYARVPVLLKIRGRYHQIAKFFYNVSKLDRIINMEDIEFLEPEDVAGEIVVHARVLATTFRALPPRTPGDADRPGGGRNKGPAKRRNSGAG